MVLTESTLKSIVVEELTKSEVNSMISDKLERKVSSQEFKKIVKALAADVINELFKVLWQRNSTWKSSVSN